MELAGIDLGNYAGLWSIEPTRFNQMVDMVNRMDLAAHVRSQEPRTLDLKEPRSSVAVIDIQGTMTKAGSSLGGGGTIEARHAVRKAEESDLVKSIVIRFDTPGGTVSGTADLASEIAKTTKPTVAFVEDLCASAGYWCASQCDAIYANAETAQIGSIGTFMALYDISKALENQHVKTVLVKAGEFKAGGFPGVEVSEEQIAEWQKMIDGIQRQFNSAIAKGRKMTAGAVSKVANGLTFMASDAQKHGLIDGVKSFDEVVDDLRAQRPLKGTYAVASTQVADYQAIVEACRGVDESKSEDALFIASCLREGMSSTQAMGAWCIEMKERIQNSEARVQELESRRKRLVGGNGAIAVGTRPGRSARVSSFEEAVNEQVAKGKSRSDAVRYVARNFPELRQDCIDDAN